MIKQKNNKAHTEANSTNIWIAILTMIFLFVGIITAVIGISNIENYYSPYLFVFIFGSVGLAIGIITAIKLKPYIAVNKKMKNNYWTPTMFISTGFIGILILTASLINRNLSKIENCDNFSVVNKTRSKSGYRRPELNHLFVIVNGKNLKLLCGHNYWDKIFIGQQINLCFHSSSIGFDYISLTDDKLHDK